MRSSRVASRSSAAPCAGLPAGDQWPSDVPDPHRPHRLTAARIVLAYSGQCPPCGPWAARTLAYLLQPIWQRRGTREAYADQPGGSEASGPAGSGSASALSDTDTAKPIAAFVGQADEYIALEIVQYLNRYLDIVWNRITTLTLLSLLLMTAVNSYPFQPAGALSNWMIVVILLAVAVVVSVLWGIQRNEFIARVSKAGVNRSLWNLEFVGRLTAYVAPVLGLLAVLSVGVSDVLRIVLGPFAR